MNFIINKHTMKLLLFFVVLCFCGFTQDSDKCIIVPFKGINNIVVGESSFEDVKKEFGEKKKRRKWSRAELKLFGIFEYFMKYDQIGTFSSIGSARKNTINEIIIDSTCKCRTKNGLGIGSYYQEIVKELGKPKYFHNNDNDKEINYEVNYTGGKLYMIITLDGKDTITNKIREIRWYASYR